MNHIANFVLLKTNALCELPYEIKLALLNQPDTRILPRFFSRFSQEDGKLQSKETLIKMSSLLQREKIILEWFYFNWKKLYSHS